MRYQSLTKLDQFESVREAWNELASENVGLPPLMDVTSTYEWSRALIEAFLEEGDWAIVTALDGDVVHGILPVYEKRATEPGAPRGSIGLLAELNTGRSGPLMRDWNAEVLEGMLAYVGESVFPWQSLALQVPSGGPADACLASVAHEGQYIRERATAKTSPCIRMQETFADYLGSLEAPVRREIKRRDRRFFESGEASFRLFDSPAEVDRLVEDVMRIERESWKQHNGSSITARAIEERFYRTLLPIAARGGLLLAGVLYLGERPVAHQLDLAFGGVASCLKTTYVEDLASKSPGMIVILRYLEAIHARGLRTLDFMGACDPHKMRLTDHVYSVQSYRMFNRSLRGRLAHLRMKGATRLKAWTGAGRPAEQQPQTSP